MKYHATARCVGISTQVLAPWTARRIQMKCASPLWLHDMGTSRTPLYWRSSWMLRHAEPGKQMPRMTNSTKLRCDFKRLGTCTRLWRASLNLLSCAAGMTYLLLNAGTPRECRSTVAPLLMFDASRGMSSLCVSLITFRMQTCVCSIPFQRHIKCDSFYHQRNDLASRRFSSISVHSCVSYQHL
jgi:hypothetical protein